MDYVVKKVIGGNWSFLLSITDEGFFSENIVNINRRVVLVLFCAAIVPISFVVMTIAGVWFVSFKYAINVFFFSIISAVICSILNRFPKTQKLTMYLGIMFASLFVFLLGYNGVVILTVAYAFAPVISCLYYNIKLTRITTIVNFISIVGVFWLRSYSVDLVTLGIKDHLTWFIENVIGIIIEFIFVYIITDAISRRTSSTFRHLISSIDDRNVAFDELKSRNTSIIELNRELETTNKELAVTQFKIIEFVAKCLGSHDLFTGRHVIHTQKYVEIICHELRDKGFYTDILTDRNIQLYSNAAFLHDIGKIHIPEGILNKIGKFTDEEFEMMKSHPAEGQKLLEFLPQIDNGDFNKISKQMAYCHHEKWDGSGYPNGLSGEQIPLCARIMAAADVLDALISQRLYKDPMSVEEAMSVFNKSKGLHFEPCIADAVIACKTLIFIIDQDFKTSEASTNAEELSWWKHYHENLK